MVKWFDNPLWIDVQIKIILGPINLHHYFFPFTRISVGNYPLSLEKHSSTCKILSQFLLNPVDLLCWFSFTSSPFLQDLKHLFLYNYKWSCNFSVPVATKNSAWNSCVASVKNRQRSGSWREKGELSEWHHMIHFLRINQYKTLYYIKPAVQFLTTTESNPT